MSAYTYRANLRPVGFDSLPKGMIWEYVEAPHAISHMAAFRNMPRSVARFGTIRLQSKLTADECARYGLEIAP